MNSAIKKWYENKLAILQYKKIDAFQSGDMDAVSILEREMDEMVERYHTQHDAGW